LKEEKPNTEKQGEKVVVKDQYEFPMKLNKWGDFHVKKNVRDAIFALTKIKVDDELILRITKDKLEIFPKGRQVEG